MKAFLRDTVMTLIIAVVVFFGLQAAVQSFVIDGPSMTPNFHDGQRILVNKAVYRFHEPERGDVVVFLSPNSQHDDYIKRIIGLPGESVEIIGGTVYIYGGDDNVLSLDEPYIMKPADKAFKGDTIPDNEYFVLGDNRQNSNDSRLSWTLPRQNIIGKVWLSIWPPDEWELMPDYTYRGE